jgi:hypothetical protein
LHLYAVFTIAGMIPKKESQMTNIKASIIKIGEVASFQLFTVS